MAKTHELVDTTRTHAIGGKVFMEIPGQMDEPAEDRERFRRPRIRVLGGEF